MIGLPGLKKRIKSSSFSSCGDWILPASIRDAVGVLLCVVAIICVFPGLFAISVLLERKGLAGCRIAWVRTALGRMGFFSRWPMASSR